MRLWNFIEAIPAPAIDNMFTFLLITCTVSVIGSLILLQPVERK